MAYTQDTYLLQASFTEAQIDALIEDGYKAYDRFAEAYLNYSNEVTKPATFTVYGGSYTMKNSEVPVEIDAATTNMTISSVLRDGTYYNKNTSFALTATDFINNGTLNISKAADDESDYFVTFTSNATFTNNNSVSVSNAIFDVANVVNTATFNLTDGAAFAATTVTNSGTFNLTGDAMFDAGTVTNSGTIKLTDAGFGADVANTGAIYVYGQTTEIEGEFTSSGSINYMAGTSSEKKGAQKNKITGDNTINFLTQTDGNRRFFTASDFDVEGTVINIMGTSVSFSGNTTLTAGELNVTSYTNEAGTKTYAGAVKITGRTVGEQIAKNVSLNIGDLNGKITLTDVAIENSTISGAVEGDDDDASLVVKGEVTISGENVFNADIENTATGNLLIAGSLTGVQTLTNTSTSASIGTVTIGGNAEVESIINEKNGKITIDGNAEVESISNKNNGKITVSNGATLKAGSISNKKAGNYVQTIAVAGGTLIADSVDTTGANFNVTGESTLEIGKDDDAAGLAGTITLGDADNAATLSGSFVKGGAINVAGAVTLSDENTLSDITVNGTLSIAKNATLNASSLTVDGGSLSLGAGSTVDLGEEGDLISTVGLTGTSVTVIADEITAEGKDLTFLSSNVSADTITAGSVVFRNATTLNIGTITEGTAVTIRSKGSTGTRAMVTNSKVGTGSVTTENLAGFSGTNEFDVINNTGNLTVAGSLTATSIDSSADGASFKVTAAGTQLNTKFTGTITFADGATLGNSSFGADSVITATNFAIADEAAVTLKVGEATKLNANISSGTINLVSGFDTETAPEWDLYQLIDGTIGDDVTFTVDGVQAGSIKLGDETYGLIKLDTGLWLTKGQDNETLYINESYAGSTPGEKVDGHIYGYNAFASLRDPALSYSANGVDQDVKDAAKNAKNLVLTGSITDGRTLFYTDQKEAVNITTGVTGATFTERLYLMHDIIYEKQEDGSFKVYDKDGETPITQAKRPEFILAEGAKLNGGSMLKVGESLDKDDYSEETGFTRTAGAVKLTVNGDIKSFIQVNPYSSVTVSETGSVISESNGTGVTENEDRQSTYIRVNGSLTVKGDADAEVKPVQFKMQRLTFTDGGTLALNNTNAQFSRIRFYDEGFTIPTATATITVTNSIVNNFEGNKLDNIEGGYNFFVYGASETAEVKSKQKVELTLDNSEMKVSDKAVFNPNANTTINVKNASTLTVGNVTNDGAINLENGAELDVNGAVTNNATGVINVGKAGDEDESELFANSIENSGTITVTDSTLNATVVDTSAVGAKFTVGGTSTLNISGTGSSLTGTITLADGANVKATIARGGTLNVAADTAATLAEGSSVASLITNAGTLTLDGVTKTGRITNNGTVDGSASTVAGITNNAGSVNLTGKSFSSVTVKDGTVSLTAESDDTGIAVGSITNGTKGTKTAEAINGIFAAIGNVTGSGAITNYAGSINVTGDLTLTPNKTTGVRPAITNGSIYTSGTIVQVGVGSIEVTGDLTAGDIVNNAGSVTVSGNISGASISNADTIKAGSIEATGDIDNNGQVTVVSGNISGASISNAGTINADAGSIVASGAITNGIADPEADAVEGTITAGSIEADGDIVNNAGSVTVSGKISGASIDNAGTIKAASIEATGEYGIENSGTIGTSDSATAIETSILSNSGTIYANTLTAASINNSSADASITANSITAAGEDGITNSGTIEAGSIDADGGIDNNGQVTVSGKISGASVGNVGTIKAGSIVTSGAITNGIADPEADAVEGTITADSIEATGDIVNNAGSVTVSGKISGAFISNAGTIEAGSIVATGDIDNAGTIDADSIEADTIVNGIAATTDPEADPVEGTITAGSIEADGDITNNAGEIIVSGNISGASISNAGSIEAGSIEGDIVNAGSITATNVSAATVSTNAAGATFTVGGESSELTISKKLTGTITLADGANVTAMVKGGTLDVENGSTVSLTGAEGNTAAVKNAGTLTIVGGTVGAFTNNAIVNVNSRFTVKGNLNNQAGATITIDATKFDFTESDTVCAISVTGTLTNAGEISVTGGAPGEYDLIVKNDGTDKGVYLYKNSDPLHPVDMSYLLVYSDLASQYNPGESFPFAGHEYVYALSAFATATAMTKIGEDTEEIDFVTQSGTYRNLNLTLFADQKIEVKVVNGTGKEVSADLNFDNLSIAASEAGEDEDVGAITFNNDVVTGAEVANTTVAISTATVDFQGANFSASKSVTIKDDAHVTFSDDFSAAAATITGSEVVFRGAAAFAGNAAITAVSEVYFLDEANFAGTANISGSEVYFDDANFAGNATISGSEVAFDGAATFSNGEETDGVVNATISSSTVDFAGAATVEGLLKLTGSEVTAEAAITASSTNLDKNSTLNLSTGDAKLGDLTTAAGSRINLTYQSKLSFTAIDVKGNFDIDVTGLTSTKNTAPATITGIPSVTKVSIVGNNTENNVAKYFNYDTENKTLTLINKACNEIKVNSKSSLDNALKYTWEGDDGETYYADNVIVQDVTYTDALYFVNAARTAHVNQYITIEGGEFQKSVFGGKKQETAGTGRFDVVDLGGNLNLTIEDGHFAKTVVAGDNIKAKGLFYREGTITTTISGGTFDYNFAGGLLYNLTDVTSQAIVTGTSLTINSETADTIFNETVYGGNFSQKKAGSNCTFIDEKAIVRIEAGEENTIKMKALIVGSYGNGVIEKGTELTLTGNGDNLEIESVWGGCGSDYYTEDAKREYVTTMAANATRTLTFEGFKNTFNCTSIRGFSDVIVKSETDVTLINTDKYGLADASNWTFEFGSSLNGAFANNFAGDTLTLAGIADMEKDWVICDDITNFAFEGIKSINGFTGDDLVFADNAYTFGAGDNQYKLSFGEYTTESEETLNAMYLTRLA